MSEEEKPFSVKDRRQFTQDGQSRRPAEASEESQVAPAPAPEPVPPPAQVPDSSAVAGPERGPVTGEPLTLAGFLVSLGAQGLEALSSEPPRLDDARTMITILEMLTDKTEGRRTDDESRVLDSLLYELRMGYMARSRGSAS